MSKQHEVESVAFDGDWMILAVDGQVYRLPLAQVSDRLTQANEAERQLYLSKKSEVMVLGRIGIS